MAAKQVSGEPNKGGRPRKINPDEATLTSLTDLASLACTNKEAASFFKIGESTFEYFLAEFPEAREAWDHGHDNAKTSLRRKLFTLAGSNAAAAIFLAKNLLGMKDNASVAVELPVTNLTDEQLHALRSALGAAPAPEQGIGGDRAAKTVN